MKNCRRIISLCCAIVAILSVLAVSAFANNHTDEDFAFSIYAGTATLLGWRNKSDTTPIYLYIKTGTHTSIRVAAMGGIANSDVIANMTCINGEYVDYVICKVGTQYSVHSWIYENGYTKAGLKFWTADGTYDYITGVWSPDSVGTYTYATQ